MRRDQRMLFDAAANGNVPEVERLLDAGADINAKTEFAIEALSPLQISVFYRHHAVARVLLQRGADHSVSRRFGSKTPTHDAAFHGDAVMVRLMLQHGANIESRDSTLQTPLHVAVHWNYVSVVAVLLEHGADMQKRTIFKATDASIMCQAATPMDMTYEKDSYVNRNGVRRLLTAEQGHRNTAFLMGQHARLGAQSLVGTIKPDLVRMIVQFL